MYPETINFLWGHDDAPVDLGINQGSGDPTSSALVYLGGVVLPHCPVWFASKGRHHDGITLGAKFAGFLTTCSGVPLRHSPCFFDASGCFDFKRVFSFKNPPEIGIVD